MIKISRITARIPRRLTNRLAKAHNTDTSWHSSLFSSLTHPINFGTKPGLQCDIIFVFLFCQIFFADLFWIEIYLERYCKRDWIEKEGSVLSIVDICVLQILRQSVLLVIFLFLINSILIHHFPNILSLKKHFLKVYSLILVKRSILFTFWISDAKFPYVRSLISQFHKKSWPAALCLWLPVKFWQP